MTTQSRSTNSVQGDVQTASVATFMAINGTGFFSVQKPGTFTDGTPVFDGVDRYTRRGDFQLDKSGYLVNGAGYYLEGVPIDPTTGNPTGSSPQVLKFQNDFLPAQETTKIDYRANLASYPLTTKHDISIPGSELIAPGSFSAGHNPLALGTPAAPYTDATSSGTVQNNKATPSVANTGATLLSGAAGRSIRQLSAALSANFAVAGDTITVNGTIITFVASGADGQPAQRHRQHLDAADEDRLDHRNGDPVHDLRRRHHAAFRHRRRISRSPVRTPPRSPRSASPAPRRRRAAAAARSAPARSSATTTRRSSTSRSPAARSRPTTCRARR